MSGNAMDIHTFGTVGVVSTKKEFCLIIQEVIHGPFPATYEMYTKFQELLNDPENENIIQEAEKIYREWKNEKIRTN
jgi:hypothetical protein